MSTDNQPTVDLAVFHLHTAHELLRSEGLSELFLSLVLQIGAKSWSMPPCLFANHEISFEIQTSSIPGELLLTFEITTTTYGFWHRMKAAVRHGWNVFKKRPNSYRLFLPPEQVIFFKNILRVLP